jgi:hypothetical protein
LRGFEGVNVSELREQLRNVGLHGDHCHGKGSLEVFGGQVPAHLGDAPAWIDAGAVYEEFVEFTESNGPLDYVFCLDPWAAQLRSRAGETASSAKWILVSDLDLRQREGGKEYREQLKEWFDTLSFTAIAPRESWDLDVVHPDKPSVVQRQGRLYAQKPGAWQWHRITSFQPSASIVFLVRYSGSLGHLRIILDSLVRQEGAKGDLQCIILAGSEGEDPRIYLRWIALAYRDLRITLLSTSANWQSELNRLLGESPEAALVMVGDHTILPTGFARQVGDGVQATVLGVPMSLEASAHVLTGNLDPFANYDTLIRSFATEHISGVECARIIHSETWSSAEGDPAARLLQLTQEKGRVDGGSTLSLLELADLP